MLVTQEMVWSRIESLEKKIDLLLKKEALEAIETISLNETRKRLHCGTAKIKQLVKNGKLEAIVDRRNGRKTYRFTLKAIQEYQYNNKYDHVSLHADDVESAEDIAKRIFNKTERKAV